jgi:hypothetical protein
VVFLVSLNGGMRIKLNNEIKCQKERENEKKKEVQDDFSYIEEK